MSHSDEKHDDPTAPEHPTEGTKPAGNADVDQDKVDKADQEFEQAGGGH